LMKLHRLCLSFVSELYIGSIPAARVAFMQPAEFCPKGWYCWRTEEESWRKKKR
jgi:hypothetical protein